MELPQRDATHPMQVRKAAGGRLAFPHPSARGYRILSSRYATARQGFARRASLASIAGQAMEGSLVTLDGNIANVRILPLPLNSKRLADSLK